jgi:hypothetical protein
VTLLMTHEARALAQRRHVDQQVRLLLGKLSGTPAQALAVRLLHRTSGWKRLHKVTYPKDTLLKDADIPAVVAVLQDHGLVETDLAVVVGANPSDELPQLLAALDAAELQQLWKTMMPRTTRRPSNNADIRRCLLEHATAQQTLCAGDGRTVLVSAAAAVINGTGGAVRIRPTLRDLYERLEIMYFGNRHHKQREFKTEASLVECGTFKFPSVCVLRTAPIWPNRDELIAYQRAIAFEATVRDPLDSMTTISAADAAIAATTSLELVRNATASMGGVGWPDPDEVASRRPFAQSFCATWVWTRVRTLVAEAHARRKDWAQAVGELRALLAQPLNAGYRGRWSEDLALHLDIHLEQRAEALRFCVSAVNGDPHVRLGHRLKLIRRAEKLARQQPPGAVPSLADVPNAALSKIIEEKVMMMLFSCA